MISIIICSINKEYLKAIKENIAQTIGADYELIVIDNQSGKYSLSKAYNEGASSCKYEYICFLHEDIRFKTARWGALLMAHLTSLEVGLIGVAGGQYKSIVPSSWSVFQELRTINIIQRHKFSDKDSFAHQERPAASGFRDAIAIDGVFMATKKSVWTQYKFDETLLKGFHGYDIDFSLQVSQQYKIRIVFDILLEHFSEGNQNVQWMESAIAVCHKWRKALPQGVVHLEKIEERSLHIRALHHFSHQLINLSYSFFGQLRLVIRFGFFYYPSPMALRATIKEVFMLCKSCIKRQFVTKFGAQL